MLPNFPIPSTKIHQLPEFLKNFRKTLATGQGEELFGRTAAWASAAAKFVIT